MKNIPQSYNKEKEAYIPSYKEKEKQIILGLLNLENHWIVYGEITEQRVDIVRNKHRSSCPSRTVKRMF